MSRNRGLSSGGARWPAPKQRVARQCLPSAPSPCGRALPRLPGLESQIRLLAALGMQSLGFGCWGCYWDKLITGEKPPLLSP